MARNYVLSRKPGDHGAMRSLLRSLLRRSSVLATCMAVLWGPGGCSRRGHVTSVQGSEVAASIPPRAPAPPPIAVALVAASASAADAASIAEPHVPSSPKLELPGGGREIFPARRLIGFCGTPGAPAL